MRPPGSHGFRAALRTANAAAFLFSTSQAFFLLLPVYLHQNGSSPTQIGLVAGLLRASSLLARPLGGRLLDYFGRRSVIGVGGCLAITAILSLFLFPHVGMPFLAMRAVQGIGTSLVDSGLGTLVADLSPPAARAQVFAIYTVWLNLAGALMPGLGEAIARRGSFLPLFGAAALAVAGGLVTLGRLPETWRPRQEEGRPVPGLLKGAAPLLLGGVVVGLAYSILTVFVPVARIAAAPGRAGLFFFAYFVGLIGVRLAGGLGLMWLAQPTALLPAYGMLAAGLAALALGDSFHRAGGGRSGLRGQPWRPDARPLRTPAVRHPAGPAGVVRGAPGSRLRLRECPGRHGTWPGSRGSRVPGDLCPGGGGGRRRGDGLPCLGAPLSATGSLVPESGLTTSQKIVHRLSSRAQACQRHIRGEERQGEFIPVRQEEPAPQVHCKDRDQHVDGQRNGKPAGE